MPEEVLNQVEESCPIDRKHFAVSIFRADLLAEPQSGVPCA